MFKPYYAILLLVSFTLIMGFARRGLTQEDLLTAIIQIQVNTAYDDSKESLKLISRLIERLPPRQVTIKAGDRVGDLIFNTYGISNRKKEGIVSYLPKSYELLEKAILSLNSLNKPEELQEGEILIPNVPKKGWQDPGSNPLNGVPKLSIFSRARRSAATVTGFVFKGNPKILNKGRPAVQMELMELEFPIDAVSVILNDEIIGPIAKVLNYPALPVTLAELDSSHCNNLPINNVHQVLNENERQFIQQRLESKAQRDVFVFVLDTGYPDRTSYDESLTQLQNILTFIWEKHFKHKAPNLPKSNFQEPSNCHCRYVAQSIKEFRQLDLNKRIKVIYIPLTREQGGNLILATLIQTSFLLNMVKTKYPDLKVALPEQDIKQGKKFGEEKVKKPLLVDRWGDSKQVRTDTSVLQAILRIGNQYAMDKQSFVFVNESWTVEHEKYYIPFPNPPLYVVVAAVGNWGENINQVHRDFAERCVSARDTIAVMNIAQESGKTICLSSIIDEKYIPACLALGFDGRLSNADPETCATSFAAPRVAWLLAVAEAVRNGDMVEDACKSDPEIKRCTGHFEEADCAVLQFGCHLKREIRLDNTWLDVTRLLNPK